MNKTLLTLTHPFYIAIYCITTVFLIMILPVVPHEIDCYDYHVWECEECHKDNLTFAVCSGFCYEDDGTDNNCMVTPRENCSKEIEHGSLTGQYEYRTGWSLLKEKFK